MPPEVYNAVIRRTVKNGVDGLSPSNTYDLHHALITKNDVKGLPYEEKAKIHDPRNILYIPHEWNASHQNIPSREEALKMLLRHYSMEEIQEWYDSITFKTKRTLPTLEEE
jgi:hypothetical protein